MFEELEIVKEPIRPCIKVTPPLLMEVEFLNRQLRMSTLLELVELGSTGCLLVKESTPPSYAAKLSANVLFTIVMSVWRDTRFVRFLFTIVEDC